MVLQSVRHCANILVDRAMNKTLTTQTQEMLPIQKVQRLFEIKQLFKELKPEMDQLQAELLQVMQDNDTLTLKTETYTLSRGKRVTPKVENFENLKKELEKRKVPYQTVTAFSRNMLPVFQKFIEDKEELEGLTGNETEYVSIRLRKEEK